ncbi:MAG TPA: hypothetical protein DHV36_13715 [Desulfobacteraceae bacterium]|nr:hypothetical protein [Desulfobacteraceae bacterium]
MMRKLLLILMLTLAYALGMASQHLIAGNWATPPYGTLAPELTTSSSIILGGGRVLYSPPDGWKVVASCPSAGGGLLVSFLKLE